MNPRQICAKETEMFSRSGQQQVKFGAEEKAARVGSGSLDFRKSQDVAQETREAWTLFRIRLVYKVGPFTSAPPFASLHHLTRLVREVMAVAYCQTEVSI